MHLSAGKRPVVTSDNRKKMARLKKYLATQFEIKNLDKLKYFLGIEVARSENGILLSQMKYVLNLLKETRMLGCKPIDTPIEVNHNLKKNIGELVDNE